MRILALLVTAMACAAHGQEAIDLKVMTFNIRYGTANDGLNSWDHRRDMVSGLIDESGMDVVGVQEALRFQLNEIMGEAPQYAEIGVGRDDGHVEGEFSSILYLHARFAVGEAGTFWLSETPDEPGSTSWGNSIPRVCTWARLVDKQSGRDVLVYNTHFDHRSQASRERGAELIASHIEARRREHGQGVPVVVMGDLNAGEDNGAVEYLLAKQESTSGREDAPPSPSLVDTYRAMHPDETDAGTFSGFLMDMTGGPKIDYVFVDDDAVVRDAGIDRQHRGERYPSDHFPVWAQVRWDGR